MFEKNHTVIKPFRKLNKKNIVAITGMTRSGKSLLAPIICSFKGAERLFMDYVFEQFPYLHSIGGLSEESAVYLMRYSFDTMAYDEMIGRNTNFRFNDLSSVWKTYDPEKYINRLNAPDRDIVYKKLKKQKPLFVIMLHNSLMHAEILFKALPAIKLLQMVRHPLDIIHSWYLKGYGHNFWENPRVANLTIKWKKHILPYYVLGWEEDYINYSEMDRIINMVVRIMSREIAGLASLSEKNKKKVLIIPYEGLVLNSKVYINKICKFLGTQHTLNTQKTIQNQLECFTRPLNNKDNKMRMKKRYEIKKLSSSAEFRVLEEMINKYESKFGI